MVTLLFYPKKEVHGSCEPMVLMFILRMKLEPCSVSMTWVALFLITPQFFKTVLTNCSGLICSKLVGSSSSSISRLLLSVPGGGKCFLTPWSLKSLRRLRSVVIRLLVVYIYRPCAALKCVFT